MQDARPLLFIGFAFLCFGSFNAYVGFSLYGERGLENRKKILTAVREVRELSAKQIAERAPKEPKQ